MTEERQEHLYSIVHRMVIWDESREDVFHRLAVNGLLGAQAEALYQRARRERIAAIRADSLRKALVGFLFLAAGIGTFCAFWIGMGGITRLLFMLCALAGGFGAWRLIDGLTGFASAHTKRGSLASAS